MRILFASNAIWSHTGYGTQAKYLFPRLQALGHAMAQFAWYGLHGATIQVGEARIYPGIVAPFGEDIIGAHVAHWQADLVISLQDIWVLPEDYGKGVRPAKWCCWLPVDHEPVPERVWTRAAKCDYPAPYSRHGVAQLAAKGVTSTYMPLGCDVAIFQPGAKEAARTALGIAPEAYMVAMVAANKGTPSRKGFPENLQAFAAFRQAHPEALLYLHTEESNMHDGVSFDKLLPACGIPAEAVRFVDQYSYIALGLPADYLTNVYQAADVLLASSYAEGFGIPLIEAQACGCPVITTDWTSMPELTFNGISTQPAQRFWTPMDSWTAIPSVENVTRALEAIYQRGAKRPAEAANAAAFGVQMVRDNFGWDVIVERHWQPLLERIQTDIERERSDAS